MTEKREEKKESKKPQKAFYFPDYNQTITAATREEAEKLLRKETKNE